MGLKAVEAGATPWERSVRWDWVEKLLGISLVGLKRCKERSLQVIAFIYGLDKTQVRVQPPTVIF